MTTTPPTSFTFPPHYSFPPFFTLQPTTSTLHSQSLKWSSLIQSYCSAHHLYRLSLSTALTTPLFQNTSLKKSLSLHDAREIIEFMVKEGRAEWIDKVGDGGGDRCWIWWKTPDEWAGMIADWVEETGQKGTVLTLYELTESEATLSQEFHGMDPEVLQKALAILVKRGKAQVFGQEDQQGVKFF